MVVTVEPGMYFTETSLALAQQNSNITGTQKRKKRVIDIEHRDEEKRTNRCRLESFIPLYSVYQLAICEYLPLVWRSSNRGHTARHSNR